MLRKRIQDEEKIILVLRNEGVRGLVSWETLEAGDFFRYYLYR